MFQTVITIEQFADIFEGMTSREQVDAGFVMSTTGRHPDLGCCVVLQDPHPGLILHSELPFQDERPVMTQSESVSRHDELLAAYLP